MSIVEKLKIPLSHLIALVLFIVLGIFLLDSFYISAKDEISYISIAEKYANGEFLAAPNALWSPLLSWLLAVLIRFGVSPLFGAKLLSLMIGAFTFFAVRSLSYRFEMSDRLRALMLFLLIPILLYCSLIHFTPDLLLAGVMALYLSIIFNRKYAAQAWMGWACGILGALLYFTKSYALFFFLFHFPLINLLQYFVNAGKPERKIVLRNFVSGLLVFFVLAGGWVYLLNLKYHEVTIGVNGKYNYRKAGPEYKGNPNSYIGFAPPPDATATSHWEDPYYYFSRPDLVECCLKPWSPVESLGSLKYQINRTVNTTLAVSRLYQGLSFFFITIVVASILFCIASWQQFTSRIELAFGLLTFFLYSGGYCIFYVEERYLWTMWILILLMGVCILSILLKTEFFASNVRKALLVTAFSASFLLPALARIIDGNSRTSRIGGEIETFTNLLKNDGLEGSKIASNRDYGTAVGIAYRLRAKYYGVSEPYDSENEIVEELKKNGIEYYFVIYEASNKNSSPNVQSSSLVKVKELEGKTLNLSVYSVR